MHNAPLIFAAAKNSAGLPLFLKRGFGSKLNEFLLAAEGALLGRLSMKRSVSGVFLCERGIRTFEDAMRFTFDVGAIPFLKEKTALPVIADPSHPAGTSRFVLSLAKSAISAGADGLMLEVHASPLTSWSDSTQTISPQQFKSLVQSIQAN